MKSSLLITKKYYPSSEQKTPCAFCRGVVSDCPAWCRLLSYKWPVDLSTCWPVDPLTFSKKNPSRAIPRSTYIHPPSLAKIRQRTSEEIGNKQTNRQTNVARFIVWLHMKLFVGYSKAPKQPQSSARPICQSHTMTSMGREPTTICIVAYIGARRATHCATGVIKCTKVEPLSTQPWSCMMMMTNNWGWSFKILTLVYRLYIFCNFYWSVPLQAHEMEVLSF